MAVLSEPKRATPDANITSIWACLHTMSLESLNQAHGIPSKVSFVAGKNGMTRADLTLHGASASVYLLGATVTSFQDEPGKDIIWVRYVPLIAL